MLEALEATIEPDGTVRLHAPVRLAGARRGDASAIVLDDAAFASGSLRIASYARPGKLFTASADLIVGAVRTLTAEASGRVFRAIVLDVWRERQITEYLRHRRIWSHGNVVGVPVVGRERGSENKQVSPTVPSWNQFLGWLREMDLLRRAEAA